MYTSVVAGCAFAACLLVPGVSRGNELPNPLSLDALVELIHARSPQLVAAKASASASRLRVGAVGLLEDPVASLEWWQQPVDFSKIPLMLTLRQALPWPGRLRARRLVEERVSEGAGVRVDETARELVATAKGAYLELLLAEGSIVVNDQVRGIVRAMVSAADARYRVGKGTQADVLKVEAELLTVENDRLDLEEKQRESRTRLNTLLDRPGDAPLPTLVSAFAERQVPSVEDGVQLAIAQQPAVRIARRAVAEAEARLASARHDGDPELAVWAAYQVTVHGVDNFTAGVSTSLPVFSARRRRASVPAEDAELTARRAALRAAERSAEGEVRTLLLQVEVAERHARLHADKLIPVADLALKSAEAAYQNDRIDLLAVLDAARMVRDHHLNHLKYVVEHQRRLAELERVLGVDLVATSEVSR